MGKKGFHSAPLTDSDIEAKPIVLLIGQYSTVCASIIYVPSVDLLGEIG